MNPDIEELKETKPFKSLSREIARAIAKKKGIKLAIAKKLVAAKPELVLELMDPVQLAMANLEAIGETPAKAYQKAMAKLEKACK